MISITDVEINRFRSIRDTSLGGLGHFSVLAGLNNSGKSNFLRALNLFFTGRPEPEVSFDLLRNYYRGDISSKRKKTISISVRFHLAATFAFRKQLESAETLLGRQFVIRKEWSLGQTDPLIFLNTSSDPLGQEDAEKVGQFLSLISFRYIPNRVIPTDLIRQEQQALRDVLVRRLAKFKIQSKQVFEGLKSTAESLVSSVSDDMVKFAPDVSKVRLATAASLADLAFQFGYRLSEGGAEMDETEQGSGLQSLLMFETLHLIDRDYFQKFGWKQAAIWAVEEPESSLNAGLEAQAASLLARIAQEKGGRLQILGTTHSDLMIQYADKTYLAEKKVVGARLQSVATTYETRDLLELSARHGVARWVNPLLYYPLEPLVLVEGKNDRDFMMECMRLMAVPRPPRIACLADIKQDPSKGGVESLLAFIRENAAATKSRKAFAKVAVVLDWDANSKLGSFQSHFHAADPFVCLAWQLNQSNPMLSESFRGIERFFPDRLIKNVEAANPNLIFRNPKGVATVPSAELGKVKTALNREVALGLQSGDEVHAKGLVGRLLAALV